MLYISPMLFSVLLLNLGGGEDGAQCEERSLNP